MRDKKLHIISFDIPWPANYGGVIDVFYKLKAMHSEGWKIHLHSFMYGRNPAEELLKYCDKVSYYKRDISKSQLFLRTPYIVCSRSNRILLDNLLEDDAPIFFEGLHCSGLLQNGEIAARKTIVRTHNIEHNYYRHLAMAESNLFKRFYFSSEATKLESYEPVLLHTGKIAAITKAEKDYFNEQYNGKSFYLPAFHPYDEVNIKEGKGDYAIYHGNLSVAENHKVAMFLAREVFSSTEIKFVISGNHPKAELKEFIKTKGNIELIENPSEEKLNDLITNAHVHVLPTFQSTGIKLKLLASLFKGRHVLVNEEMIAGTELESLCNIADDAESFRNQTLELMNKKFSSELLQSRKEVLLKYFSNKANAELLGRELDRL